MFESLNDSYKDFESFLLNPSLEEELEDIPKKEIDSNFDQSFHQNTSTNCSKLSKLEISYPSIGLSNSKYKPIEDNGLLYTYEKDPLLYKKIRKRIQNRESQQKKRGKI